MTWRGLEDIEKRVLENKEVKIVKKVWRLSRVNQEKFAGMFQVYWEHDWRKYGACRVTSSALGEDGRRTLKCFTNWTTLLKMVMSTRREVAKG